MNHGPKQEGGRGGKPSYKRQQTKGSQDPRQEKPDQYKQLPKKAFEHLHLPEGFHEKFPDILAEISARNFNGEFVVKQPWWVGFLVQALTAISFAQTQGVVRPGSKESFEAQYGSAPSPLDAAMKDKTLLEKNPSFHQALFEADPSFLQQLPQIIAETTSKMASALATAASATVDAGANAVEALNQATNFPTAAADLNQVTCDSDSTLVRQELLNEIENVIESDKFAVVLKSSPTGPEIFLEKDPKFCEEFRRIFILHANNVGSEQAIRDIREVSRFVFFTTELGEFQKSIINNGNPLVSQDAEAYYESGDNQITIRVKLSKNGRNVVPLPPGVLLHEITHRYQLQSGALQVKFDRKTGELEVDTAPIEKCMASIIEFYTSNLHPCMTANNCPDFLKKLKDHNLEEWGKPELLPLEKDEVIFYGNIIDGLKKHGINIKKIEDPKNRVFSLECEEAATEEQKAFFNAYIRMYRAERSSSNAVSQGGLSTILEPEAYIRGGNPPFVVSERCPDLAASHLSNVLTKEIDPKSNVLIRFILATNAIIGGKFAASETREQFGEHGFVSGKGPSRKISPKEADQILAAAEKFNSRLEPKGRT